MSREEFVSIYNKIFYKLFDVVKGIVVDRQVAEDILADAFVSLWINRGRSIENPEAYLVTSCKNLCYNFQRNTKKHFRIEADLQRNKDVYASPILANEEYLEVMAVVPQLPDQCQQIFRLFYLHDLTNEEIADKLQVSLKTVSNQKTIAVKKLKEF